MDFHAKMCQNGAFSRGLKFPGSRGFFPGKREAKIHKFPWNSQEETLVMRGSQFPGRKLSLKLTEVDQTWLNLSWAGCARPEIAILKLSTRGPSLFSDRNEKMGLDGAMVHLEG